MQKSVDNRWIVCYNETIKRIGGITMIFKQTWQGKNCRTEEVFPASVPGNIQRDFGIFKKFGDVNYADNYKQYIPYEDDFWEYSTTLDYKKNEGERVLFVTEGIIYKYEISLNGEKIYEYEGMYKRVELDLSKRLCGNDELKILIYPHPKSKNGAAGTRDEADESCMPPVCYGWDWNPRLLVSGLWEDAYIETRDDGYVSDHEVFQSLSDDFGEGYLTFKYSCKLPCEISVYDAENNLVGVAENGELTVKSPKLWWCNGQGEQYLYKYVISNEKSRAEGYFGFRRIRLVRNIGKDGPRTFPKGRYEAPITVEINGRRIFAKGSNWVNPDVFWGAVDEERLTTLVSLARDCNMNIFRMWGGAGLAKMKFYDLCDRYGIMVWQEFPLACNNYKGKPHYMNVLRSEALSIITKLRRHPSLAIWCGGNELFNSWSGMDDQSPPLRLLNSLCFTHDEGRPFLMTSPLFGMAHGGYTFYHERQGGEVFTAFGESENTAYTEFGVPSVASVDVIKRIIPKDEQFPPRDTAAWRAHHGFGAWMPDSWVCLPTYEQYFGKPTSLEELVEGTTLLECEGYHFIFEEARRQWPACSMAINWCYNEPWNTAAGNNLIEYPVKPKPCYDYVKNALRPVLFSAKAKKLVWKAGEYFEFDLWLLNDTQKVAKGEVRACVELGGETFEVLRWNAEADSNRNAQGPTARFMLPNVSASRLKLILESDGEKRSEYVFLYRPDEKKLQGPKVLNL